MNQRRFVLLTGASSGIGEKCLAALLGSGYDVIACVLKEQYRQDLINSYSSERMHVFIMDMIVPESILAAYEQIIALVGNDRLYAVVNCAGIAVSGPLEFLPVKEIKNQFEVNLFGVVTLIQTFMPLIRKGNGRIINISSNSGRISGPFVGPYSMAKFALEAFSNSLRIELMPWGIPISVIGPGMVKTPIWDKSIVRAQNLFRELPEHGQDLYRQSYANSLKICQKLSVRSLEPEVVAHKLLQALNAKKPKARYAVGIDALIFEVLRILPDSFRDRLLFRMFKVSPEYIEPYDGEIL